MRYSLAARTNLITSLTTDAVAILINAPIYGGLIPTLSQLEALDSITMQDIIRYELTGTYKRFIYGLLPVTQEVIGLQTFVKVEAPALFDTTITNATHIVYVYGALTTGADSLNFNNRGDGTGIPLLVKPIANAPVSIVPPAVLEYTFNIKLGSG